MLPELKGKLDGFAMRVPTPDGSVVDLVVELQTRGHGRGDQRGDEGGRRERPHEGHPPVQEDPIVSIDIVGNRHSSIFDPALTMAKGTLVKVVSWYDNEWGYSNRLVELAQRVL